MRQISALFLVFLVLGASSIEASKKSSINKQVSKKNPNGNVKIIELIENGSRYVVDEVVQLLQDLEDAAAQDLSDLNAAWATQQALLQQLLQDATNTHAAQQQQCDYLAGQQSDLENQIANLKAEVQQNSDQIEEDAENIAKLKAERCAASQAYIDHLVVHRSAIALFEALEQIVSDYEAGSFLEKRQISKKVKSLKDVINVFAQKHADASIKDPIKIDGLTSELHAIFDKSDLNKQKDSKDPSKLFLPNDYFFDPESNKVSDFAHNPDQLDEPGFLPEDFDEDFDSVEDYKRKGDFAGRVKGRGDFGNGYADNDKDQIELDNLDQGTVRDLANIRGQLMALLDSLIANENANYASLQVEESNANEAAASYKQRLQDEQRALKRRNEALSLQISQLEVRLAEKEDEVDACEDQEAILLSIREDANQNLVDATGRYLDRKDNVQEEINLFHVIYLFYKQKVYDVATLADKQRVQDYSDDQNFGDESYTHKSAEDFEFDEDEEKSQAEAFVDGDEYSEDDQDDEDDEDDEDEDDEDDE